MIAGVVPQEQIDEFNRLFEKLKELSEKSNYGIIVICADIRGATSFQSNIPEVFFEQIIKSIYDNSGNRQRVMMPTVGGKLS